MPSSLGWCFQNKNFWRKVHSVWSGPYIVFKVYHIFSLLFHWSLCYLFSVPALDYQLLLALGLAIREINWNPHLLPNISLIFDVSFHKEFNGILLSKVFIEFAKIGKFFPNYNCKLQVFALAALTGPTWLSSSRMASIFTLINSPQVRLCVKGKRKTGFIWWWWIMRIYLLNS